MTAISPPEAIAAPVERTGGLAAVERVLRSEAEGILAMIGTLDESLPRALDLLFRPAGRIIVTGIGKSGHIARKIAATLASTGSPAYFIHPAEASHGDLGMIRPIDAVIALSNSGETPELYDIVAYIQSCNTIPLVAITSRAGSTLARKADAALILPPVQEACPMGLAPTTSTTMALALGDAIAIALLERRGFTPEQFRARHPGGQLGRKLLRVCDIMHAKTEIPVASPQTRMDEAILIMTSKRFGCVGVVDEAGALIGIVTDGDLRRHMASDLLQQSVASVMTAKPRTIGPQALAVDALTVMNMSDRPVTSLFVVEEGRPIGIVHVHDCLRAGVA